MPSPTAPQLRDGDLDAVLGALTTEEKALLVVGVSGEANIEGLPDQDPLDRELPDPVAGAAGRTHPVERLGIPMIVLADGPAGVRIDPTRAGDDRTYYATAFPIATLLASSWDPETAREVGAAIGREALAYGVDVLLAPGMNVHRGPLGGRNFEYYSEDPLLAGRMAGAYVRGVQSEGVAACVKHLAANNQEWNRMQLDARVSERALREIYLRAFEIALAEGEPWTLMTAYNRVNGQYAPESHDLLTTLLRDEWAWEGTTMTDWFAGADAVDEVAAGTDLVMPGNRDEAATIVAAAEAGTLTALDDAVRRVLDLIVQTPSFLQSERPDAPDLADGRAVSRRAAADGMVLLKNELVGEAPALPLQPGARLALFGVGGYRTVRGGTGSGNVNVSDTAHLDDGLKEAGYALDDGLEAVYRLWVDEAVAALPPEDPLFLSPPLPEWAPTPDALAEAARSSDLALVVVTRNSGEFADREVDGDFLLTDSERSLIAEVSRGFREADKAVVVVLNVGGVIETASWRDHADAVLLAWQPGQEAGHAIADVLSGAVAPSGKLPMTWPVAYEDVPAAAGWPGTLLDPETAPPGPTGDSPIFGAPAQTNYHDGVYVGYRYYDTADVTPAYPFGFGLSYTTFEISDVGRVDGDGLATITATVTNTGGVAGREVVQLYVRAAGGPDRPAQELRAFAKTDRLAPGASETVELTLDVDDVVWYDTARSAWVAAPGTYTAAVGSSSRDIAATVEVEVDDEIVQPVTPVLRPEVEIPDRLPAR